MKKIIFYITFILWITANLVVRMIDLEKSPVSLNFDEAALGYNAYSILLTQKDEFDVKFPLALRSFNDYKPALYTYLTIPFVKYMGLNQTSTRAVSAIAGTVSLIFLYLVIKQLLVITAVKSLLISIFISFLPWRLHYSRVAFESNLSQCFFIISVWALINFYKNKSFKLISIIFSILSIYSYHGARLAIPVLWIMFIYDPIKINNVIKILNNKLPSLKKLWPLFIIVLSTIPIFMANDSSSVIRRLSQTNVFQNNYPYTPFELRSSNLWSQFNNNPIYYISGTILGHFFSIISPQNLSLSLYHWIQKSPQGISGSGVIGWLGVIFFMAGLPKIFSNITLNKNHRLIIYWIFAGVIPAVITLEWFHPLRSLNSFPAIELIIALGIIQLFKKNNIIVRTVFVILIFVTSVYNINNELNYAAWSNSGEFQPGGYKEGASLLNQLKDKYQTIYLDSPHAQNYIMFLFYMNYPPKNIQAAINNRPSTTQGGILNFNFDNFVYKKYNWLEERKKNNFMIWTSAEVLENEISAVKGAKLYKIYDPFNSWVASIITKE